MSDTHDAMIEAGVIVGEASPTEFLFVSKAEDYPTRWEHVVVSSKERVGDGLMEVPVIAQVESIISASQALNREVDLEAIRRILAAGLETSGPGGGPRSWAIWMSGWARYCSPEGPSTPAGPST